MAADGDRQIVATLVFPGVQAPDGVLGAGVLIDPRLAIVEFETTTPAQEVVLSALEVVIAPMTPEAGDRIERIRPTKVHVGALDSSEQRTMAALVLAYPSRREGVQPFDAADMGQAFIDTGAVLEGFRQMGLVPDLPPQGQALLDYFQQVRAVELANDLPRIEDYGTLPAAQIVKVCCPCSTRCIPVPPDEHHDVPGRGDGPWEGDRPGG